MMNPILHKVSIAVALCSLTACGNLGDDVGNQLDALRSKTLSLDSLVNKEVNKVQALDSLIQMEADRVKQLDSMINTNASRLDSIARAKMK
jgi:hypothetical protein